MDQEMKVLATEHDDFEFDLQNLPGGEKNQFPKAV